MRHHALRGGDKMPALGLGTWKSAPGEVGAAVRTAIDVGYRHIDCAAIYGNEAEVGQALADCGVPRDDLWITSKLWCNAQRPEDVLPALKQTLRDLRLDTLDLYLIHWPIALRRGVSFAESAADLVPRSEIPLAETWEAMSEAVDQGLARHIGVSNFTRDKIRGLLSARRPPQVNQIELHPYLQQRELLAWCDAQDIRVTAYSPLGSRDRPAALKAADEPDLLADPTITAIARNHDATPAQVLIAWALQRGTSVIPKSTNPGRIAENFAAAELRLSGEDMEQIGDLERHRRYVDGSFWEHEGGPYTTDWLWNDRGLV